MLLILLVVIYLTYFAVRMRRRWLHDQALLEFRWHEGMSPLEFERHCSDYLRLRGWNAQTTTASGDQGVDVLAEKVGVRVVLQCKLYERAVGNKAVQEAYAAQAHKRAHYAAVVSNANYTRAAQQLAASTGVKLLHFTDLAAADRLFGVNFAAARPWWRRLLSD